MKVIKPSSTIFRNQTKNKPVQCFWVNFPHFWCLQNHCCVQRNLRNSRNLCGSSWRPVVVMSVHCTIQHYTTLHYTTLHCIASLHFTTLHYTYGLPHEHYKSSKYKTASFSYNTKQGKVAFVKNNFQVNICFH